MAAWRRQLMSVFLLRQLALERLPQRTPCNQLGDAEACMDRAWQDLGFASLASPASQHTALGPGGWECCRLVRQVHSGKHLVPSGDAAVPASSPGVTGRGR